MKFHKHITSYLTPFLFLLPVQLFAAEEKAAELVKTTATGSLNNEAMSGGYLMQLVIGLFIVLLCIVVLAWFAKKMKHFNPLVDGSLKVIGGLSMGSRERVALLQVGDKQLLIGIAPGRINTLHVLDTPIEMANNDDHSPAGKNFLDKFKTAMADANNASEK